MAAWPSGKAEACKAFIPRFESGCRLQYFSWASGGIGIHDGLKIRWL